MRAGRCFCTPLESLAKAQTRPSVQAVVSRTDVLGSVLSALSSTGTACSTRTANCSAGGPSKMEPSAIVAASLARQSFVSAILTCTNGSTLCTIVSGDASDNSARHAPAAVARFHVSSSWSSSWCMRHSNRTGHSAWSAWATNLCERRSDATESPISNAAASSSRSAASSSAMVLQNSIACRATFSSGARIAPATRLYRTSMYCGSIE
mmetsp:Transcript_4332/g.11860  ORF Transcript_4332/g.11860 Transcript_4332/m.11860 type:complete len:208 (-) Transcript_4332:778-1401(-)